MKPVRTPPPSPIRSAPVRGPLLLLSGSIGFFALLKLYALHPVIGDENIYFYLASRTADGLFPYRDFVFTHPPLQIYLMAALAWIGRNSFPVLKAAPMAFVFLSGLLIHRIAGERPFRELLPNRYWMVAPVLLFWFSYDTLRISSHYTGVNQATFLLLLGWWLFLRGSPAGAGGAFAASVSTAVYVAPLAGLAIWWCGVRDGRRFFADLRQLRRLAIGGAAAVILIHLPVWILAPGAWWEQTISYHARKPPVGSSFGDALSQFLAAEGFQAAAALLAGFVVSAGRKKGRIPRVGVPGIVYILIFALLGRVYIYYFLPAFPFLALGATIFLREIWHRLRRGRRRLRNRGLLWLAAALLVQPLFYWNIPSVRRDPWHVTGFEFHPTPGIGPLNRPVSWIFPRRRLDGLPAPGVLRYLWHENSFWGEAPGLSRDLDRVLGDEATLYGDSTTTPLLAFLGGRRIACELADTNTLHFRIGTRRLEEDLACARNDGLGMLVLQPRAGIDLLPEFGRFVGRVGTFWRESTAGKRRVRIYTVEDPGP